MASPPDTVAPPWLLTVMRCDKAGSAWYIGVGFFFAPAVAILDPWPLARTIAVVLIAMTGLWLGLLGIAMATGLAIVLRRGEELPNSFWRMVVNDPALAADTETTGDSPA
ncbi:hypothetical protein AAFP30_14305 [Gordonia sp. CPCC 205515]|uniref:hypothetical protein n=1 Tax=Gordonia sp. CPCC 205515 TaxID=3140791 RepID=UPI003AF360BC